jgi:SAM-dependent methyltransferase
MRKVHYDYWADYIYSITRHFVDENPRVLELASGNCQLAYYLSAYYPKYYATDISLTMLSLGINEVKHKICCDMKFIPFRSKFDLIVSAFDSFNYLLSKKELLSVFNEVKKLMNQQSLFTFDVSLERNSFRHVKDPIRNGTYKGVKYKQETDFNEKTKVHRNVFHITYQDGRAAKEVHLQKIYSFDTYFELMDNAGLSVKECLDAFTYKDGKSTSSRVQFLAVKK